MTFIKCWWESMPYYDRPAFTVSFSSFSSDEKRRVYEAKLRVFQENNNPTVVILDDDRMC